MKVLEYLNKYGLEKLVEEFSIKVSVDERLHNLKDSYKIKLLEATLENLNEK